MSFNCIGYNQLLLDEIICLYRNSVKNICKNSYNEEEINVWLDAPISKSDWHQRFSENHTLILKENNEIIAYGVMSSDGKLDLLYTHFQHQSKGLASYILKELEKKVKTNKYTLISTKNALSFYEKHGYKLFKIESKKYHTMFYDYYFMKKIIEKVNKL